MKGKSKTQNGITLIALILTIVVLMILAAVAINSITNDGIIDKAQQVSSKYNQAQTEEQKMLDYYQLVLEGTAWTQSGTTVTRGNQTLKLGDVVTLKATGDTTAAAYSAGDYEGNWVVLGAEYGKLLLASETNVVSSVALGGANGGNIYGTECVAGYYNGAAKLDEICSAYLNTKYADEARSITVEDYNRVTGFKPESYSGYGTTYTYTAESTADYGGFMHVDGRVIGENGVESITETSTYYYYQGKTYITDTTSQEYKALFGVSGSYLYTWLASPYVGADSGYAFWGLRIVRGGNVSYCNLWGSDFGADGSSDFGARAVVSLKSDVQVVK